MTTFSLKKTFQATLVALLLVMHSPPALAISPSKTGLVFPDELEEYLTTAAVEASISGEFFGENSGFFVVAAKRDSEGSCYIDIAIYSKRKNLVDRRFDDCHDIMMLK